MSTAGLVPSGALASPTLLSLKLSATAASATLVVPDSLEVVYWQVVARGCAGQAAVGAKRKRNARDLHVMLVFDLIIFDLIVKVGRDFTQTS